jgi:hypothetical protein
MRKLLTPALFNFAVAAVLLLGRVAPHGHLHRR